MTQKQQKILEQVAGNEQALSSASEKLTTTISHQMASSSEETSTQANVVAADAPHGDVRAADVLFPMPIFTRRNDYTLFAIVSSPQPRWSRFQPDSLEIRAFTS